MENKVNLKRMHCPTCGASLKVEDPKAAIECLYCGNIILPVTEAQPAAQENFSGVLRVEGIKTSASALAYMELLFEEYDWEDFGNTTSLVIPELDQLISNLCTTSADDKNTWFACARACAVPYLKKAAACAAMPDKIAATFAEDDADAYSLFATYRQVAAALIRERATAVKKLQRYQEKAAAYGAEPQELEELKALCADVEQAGQITLPGTIEDIPQVAACIQQKDQQIRQQLAAAGIQADAVYEEGQALMQQEKGVDALRKFLSIRGYKQTDKFIEKLDRYFLLDDFLEINGRRFLFKRVDESLNLYPCVDGKTGDTPLIKGIGNIITNYADILYYLDAEYKLCKFDFTVGKGDVIGKRTYKKDKIFYYEKRRLCCLVSKKRVDLLYLATGTVTELLDKVGLVRGMWDSRLLYTSNEEDQSKRQLFVHDLDKGSTICLGSTDILVQGFLNNTIFYIRNNPNDQNVSLMRRELIPNAVPRVLEPNVYQFHKIVGNKLFFFVGSKYNCCMISMDPDGNNRREWMSGVSKILEVRGKWFYFVRKSGYNTVLCRAKADGTGYRIIASDIDSLVDNRNGYLYYLTDDNELVKVRMDGRDKQVLRGRVEKVLQVNKQQIVFLSQDDSLRTVNAEGVATTKTVSSIYSVDFAGSGIRKLVYNVSAADLFNEETIYYTTKTKKASGDNEATLCALHLADGSVTVLMTNSVEAAAPEENHGCLIAAVIVFICALFLIIGLTCESGFLTIASIIGGIVAVIYGASKMEKD